MDALMNAPEIDASEVDMSKVTWIAPDVEGNFILKEIETKEEIPDHHAPLIPTQEELDAEHVGPPEMYLGDNVADEDLLASPIAKIELPPVTIPEGFEWLLEDDMPLDTISTDSFEEGLNVPEEVLQLAKDIESKMNDLYGRTSRYTYVESNNIVIVTIEDSNEVFYI